MTHILGKEKLSSRYACTARKDKTGQKIIIFLQVNNWLTWLEEAESEDDDEEED